MPTIEILLSDAQLENIRSQLHEVILNEITKTRNQADKNQRYMNKKQTCNYLQISNNTLDSWIKQGLPKIVVSGSTRFDKIAIDEWLANLAKSHQN
ncbi:MULTISPECIES: helix-turn-helix transcriptional regulator [Enterococcaceae]|uniref:helix-turn-helix transcriptional regulator n=1 Tax=Enterococcaceae TaxID=81852 RepID=UPI0017818C88|nr:MULTISPECIES: helix-turn-helix domain-containing protein [Enterococcaceae]MDT2745983.1 helix-turn-helix domain-containing protein [Vagococcus fluvialis]QOG32406.1 helix-turn-helix domain-containing protein [Enterococcus casseliflavus]